jgi:hypothetical protein
MNFKYWEIIADNLSKAGWSWGCVAAVNSQGERSGLLSRIAVMESGSLRAAIKSSQRSWVWKEGSAARPFFAGESGQAQRRSIQSAAHG